MTRWHLAHYNVALARGAADAAIMAEFYTQVPDVNVAAERSPGFVWRLDENGPAGDDGSFRLANLSVWEDVASLRDFSYRDSHLAAFRERSKWFYKSDQPCVVLWWVPAGHRPTFAEGDDRLRLLRMSGPSGDAFDFGHPAPPPATEEAGA